MSKTFKVLGTPLSMFFMIYLCGYLLTTMPYTWIQLVRRKGKVGSKKAVQNFHVLPGLECAESILRPEFLP